MRPQIAAILIVVTACVGGDTNAPDNTAAGDRVVIVSGNDQLGAVRANLELPLVAKVIGADGEPRSDVPVSWAVADGGTLTTSSRRSDANGLVSATWNLGGKDEHEGSVRLTNGSAAAFGAEEASGRQIELLEASLLRPQTYDGSRQTVHPDFARTPTDWGAYELHLALTPYPNGATALENPSVFVSRLGYRWFPESGVTNPIIAPNTGYLSDPDLLYVPSTRELWMYYRNVDSKNRIYLVRSRDGIKWGSSTHVVEGANQTVISPSVVRRSENDWLMWTINGGSHGCSDNVASVELRRSRDGVTWGSAVPVSLRNGDLMPWHIDVQWIPEMSQYWALYPAKSSGNCATRAVFLATSSDGVQWTTYPTPVIESGELSELRDIVYRSTFTYVAADDEIRFWFSGANVVDDDSYNWRTVFQRRRRGDVFARIATARIPGIRPELNPLPAMVDPP
ncbi:MAG TPA: hypothetical protein VM099_09980 [Gemmatimonadaceae bacterium]|nr:hypothetical protein [Gemmatimonadaceae bacterium]